MQETKQGRVVLQLQGKTAILSSGQGSLPEKSDISA